LTKPEGNGPPAQTQLVVTTVTLGRASFDTDRGTLSLPAWKFRFQNVENPAEVLAVSAKRIFASPAPLDKGQAVGSAILGSNDKTLTVETGGTPMGTGPCTASYSMDIGASDTAVAVQLHVTPHYGDEACILPAVSVRLRATLAAPLGNRVLVDAASLQPVPVTSANS
jgi:hypothetical protein